MAPDISRMRAQTESEMNLLQFYRVELPTVQHVSADDVIAEKLSTELLYDHCRWQTGGCCINTFQVKSEVMATTDLYIFYL